MLEAPLLEQLELRVLDAGRLLAPPFGHVLVEHGEVLAAQEAHEVAGADDQPAVTSLHGLFCASVAFGIASLGPAGWR